MLLKEWEIWQTFSTYFVDPIQDLEKTAKNLVKSGLVESAFIDDGRFFWLNNSVLTSGHVQITLNPSRSSISFVIDNKSIPEGYVSEGLFQSIYFRFAELKQYKQNEAFPPKYIRGHLSQCQLIANNCAYSVYPIIKIFETGILLLELRIISPREGISVQNFIEEYMGLDKRDLEDVLVPPALRIAAQHEYLLSAKPKWPLAVQIGSFLIDRNLQRYIKKNTIYEKNGDFESRLVHLWNVDEIQDKTNVPAFSLSDLASTIFSAVSVSIPGLRTGKSLLVRPNVPLALGDFWSGRPHVHILKFRGQAITAKENEVKFQNEYGWIMGGVYKNDTDLGATFLPPNARAFDDYGAYIAEQGTLWVWSKKGIAETKKFGDVPNQGHLIYMNQSLCELLEYGHMLHRRLFQLIKNPQSVETALKARENLLELEMAMSEVSGYGEIRELFIKGWNDMQVKRLQAAISDMLSIRQAEASTQEGKRLAAWQIIFSLVFGIVAIPGFATGFVEPLWKWLNLWTPTDPNLKQILFFVAALLLVEFFIFWFIRSISKRTI